MSDNELDPTTERVLPSILTSGRLDDHLPVMQAKQEMVDAHRDMVRRALEAAGPIFPSDPNHPTLSSSRRTHEVEINLGAFLITCDTRYDETTTQCRIELVLVGAGDLPSMVNRYILGDEFTSQSEGDGRMGFINRRVTGSSEEIVAQLTDDLMTSADHPMGFLRDKAPQAFLAA